MNGLVYIVYIYYFERFVLFKQSKDWSFLIECLFTSKYCMLFAIKSESCFYTFFSVVINILCIY